MLIHVVQPGDTLWKLSATYRVTVNNIVAANGILDPNRLVIGQSLVMPTQGDLYVVQKGDTLYAISKKYGVSVREIAEENGITQPDVITPGTVLFIPPITYTVQPGDTPFGIAGKFGVSLPNLLKENNITFESIIYPGDILVIPRKARPFIAVNGYLYFLGQQAASIVAKAGSYLTYLGPFAYMIREDGALDPIDDRTAIQEANAQNVVPMMAITNFSSTLLGENLASAVLNNSGIRSTLLDNILGLMAQKGYLGLNIDFENVLPKDRESYNSFLQETVNRLHPFGYFVSTAVAPKTGPGQTGLLYEALDYEAHGRIVDFVILMTYEWGYRKGPPRAISPINEIKRVLDYAVTVIPRNKIFFGFQIYARDWTLPFVQGQEARTISPQDAVQLAVAHNVPIQYDSVAQSPFFRYADKRGMRHEVWFEDARSAQAKFDTIKSYKLAGISYWALGYDFPQNPELLNDNFLIHKLR